MTFHSKTYPDALRQLFVFCSIEETNKAFDTALHHLQKSLSLPGYRKGKVPVDIIAKTNPPELMNLVSDTLMKEALRHIEDQKTPLYGQPRFNPIGGLSKDKEFIFSLVYELYPVITNEIDLSSLNLNYESCEIDQKFIEDTLCRQIQLFESTKGTVQEFDLVKVEILNNNYHGEKKEASFDAEKLELLLGKKSEESFSIAFDDLSGYLPEFIGKVADPLEVKITDILRAKNWKNVSDEEIAEKTPFKTKDEYLQQSQSQFEGIVLQYNNSKKAEILSNTIGKLLNVELPKSLWLNNLRDLVVKTAEKEVLKEEIALSTISSHKEILEKFAQLPIDSLEGLAFVIWLEQLAEQQKITIEEQELEYHYYRYAQSNRLPMQDYKKNISPEEKSSIRNEAMREKVLSYLLETVAFNSTKTIPLSEVIKNYQRY
ncbi:MAG: trigger factor [Brevinema sp.]